MSAVAPAPPSAAPALHLSAPAPREDAPSAPSLRSVLADLLRAQGREVVYVATEGALALARDDPWLSASVSPGRLLRLRPLLSVARGARRTFERLLKAGCEDLSVLGLMGLPQEAWDLLLAHEARGRYALMVEGIGWTADDDTLFALDGLSALAARTGTEFVMVPPE